MSIILLGSLLWTNPARAAIAYRSASSANNGGGTTSLTINTPAGAAIGDVLVASIDLKTTATNECNVIGTEWIKVQYSIDSGATLRKDTFYRVLTATPPASYTFNFQASFSDSCSGTITAKASGGIIAYSGVDTLNPIMASAKQTNASSTTMTAPSVTTTGSNAMIVALYGAAIGTTVTSGSSMTLRYQDASTGGSGASRTTSGGQDILQAAAGASGTKTMTLASAGVNIGHTVALREKADFTLSAYRWFGNQDSTGAVTFAKIYGGSSTDIGVSLAITSDGGYAVTGRTSSFGAGSLDMFLTKYDSAGGLVFTRTWGGTGVDSGRSIVITSDGGYAVAGQTVSFGAGSEDMFLTKFDSVGTLVFSRTWGGTANDFVESLVTTSDGGYAVTGDTNNFGVGLADMFLAKFDSTGSLVFSRTWGGTSGDNGKSLVTTSDGGYAVTGNTTFGVGNGDMFLTKFDSTGSLVFSYTWGGTGFEEGRSLVATSDGGYAVTGITGSFGAGGNDMFLTKFDSAGTLVFSRTWGGTGVDEGYSLVTTSDGGYAITGITGSFGAGGNDMFLTKFDSAGTLVFSRTWGGTGPEIGNSLVATSDGGYVVTGQAGSFTGNIDDILLAKYDSSGNITDCATRCTTPTPTTTTPTPTTTSPTPTTTSPTPTTTSPTPTTTSPTLKTTVIVIMQPTVDVATPLAAQSVSATAPAPGTPFRLRMNLAVTAGEGEVGTNFRLQFAQRGTDNVCDSGFITETYSDVTTTSSIRFYDNANAVSGLGLTVNTNDPTDGRTLVRQAYQEGNPFNIATFIPAGQDGMWDFALTTDASATPGSYCLRAVISDGGMLSTYTVIPEITVASGSVDQSAYRFYQNADNTTPGTPLAAQNTASSIAAATPFRMRQLLGQTAGSTAQNAGSYKLQYSLKSGTCDTSFSGETYEDITGGSTGHIVYHNNATPADSANISSTANDPVNGSRPVVLQTYRETDPFTNSVAAIPSGSDGLWDFALTSVAAADTKTYCVRTVKSDGSLLTTYGFIPEITFGAAAPAGPTISDHLRGGQSVINGTKQPFSF